jgi:hypothetical protein
MVFLIYVESWEGNANFMSHRGQAEDNEFIYHVVKRRGLLFSS